MVVGSRFASGYFTKVTLPAGAKIMTQPNTDSADVDKPYQFGLASILVLTAVAAAIFAAVRQMDFSVAGGWLFGGYLVMLAAYIVLRMPFLLRQLFGRSARHRAIERRRKDVIAQVRPVACDRNEAEDGDDSRRT